MKNIILVTHGGFAEGILDSLSLVMGTVERTGFVSITARETISQISGMITEKLKALGEDAPTVLISDIPGGSTTQAAMQVIGRRTDVYLVTGLNLGLLLEIALMELGEGREKDLERLRGAIENSKHTLCLANDLACPGTASDAKAGADSDEL